MFSAAEALDQLLHEEFTKMSSCSLHGEIQITCRSSLVPRGVRFCSVRMYCKAGCTSRIESYGRDADMLEKKAIAIQRDLMIGMLPEV